MKLRVGIAVLILALVASIWMTWPSGYSELVITDFSKPASLAARAPWMPFRDGLMYVVLDGKIDGEGKILVYENRANEPQIISVFGPTVHYIFGGAENWSDSVRIRFEPGTIETGKLTVRLYCGAYPKPIGRDTEPAGAAIPMHTPN